MKSDRPSWSIILLQSFFLVKARLRTMRATPARRTAEERTQSMTF